MSQTDAGRAGQVNRVFAVDNDDLDRIEVISSSTVSSHSSSSDASRRLNEQNARKLDDQHLESIELYPSSNVNSMDLHRKSLRATVEEYIRTPTPTNMMRRWSQNIARFSKDSRHNAFSYERTIYRLPSRELFQADGMLPLVVSDSPDEEAAAEVNQLAAEIEQYDCLMEDTVLSKQHRLQTLRALPQPLATKRILKQKLADVQQMRIEPRHGWVRSLWEICVNICFWLWHYLCLVGRSLELWPNTLKTIERHYGSNVVSYFQFLRWLFVLNVVLAVFCLAFITLPQSLYDAFEVQNNQNNISASGHFLDFLTAEGALKSSLLFYGSYSNATFTLTNPERAYSLPHAYYMTMLVLYLSTFVVISASMARSYRRSFIAASGSTRSMCGEKIFCSWDYSISSRQAAKLKHLTIYTEMQQLLTELDKAKQHLPVIWRIWRFCSKLVAHLLVLALVAGLGFVIWIFLQAYGDDEKNNFMGWSALRVATIVNGSLLVSQSLFAWIAHMEDNYSPRRTLHIMLVRNFFLQFVVIGVVVYFWLTKEQNECWETSFGQEMYRFIISDFFLCLLVVPLIECFRVFLICHFWPHCNRPEFDISQQSVGLVYNQTLFWLGLFFSPPLAALMALKMLFTFYAKHAFLRYLCRSPRHVWHSAQSRTLYLVFIFLSLLGAIITLGYIMTQLPVTPTCGPFRDYDYMFQILIDSVLNLRANHTAWCVLMWLIRPAVVGGGLILLAIMVYYMHAKSRAHCLMVKMLKEMIYLEAKDKKYLLAKITNYTKNRDWPLEELQTTEDDSAAADRYAVSSASWRRMRRRGLHRHSAISAASENTTLSNSEECILRSRNV